MPNISIPEKIEEKSQVGAPLPPQGSPTDDNIYYAVGFLLLVASLNCVQSTITTKSRELKANADAQNAIVSQLTAIAFLKLPTNPPPQPLTIQRISEANKRLQGLQQTLQEQLVDLRQGGQILMTSGNTAVNAMEQNANANSTLLSTIHEILTLIMQIGPTKQKLPRRQ